MTPISFSSPAREAMTTSWKTLFELTQARDIPPAYRAELDRIISAGITGFSTATPAMNNEDFWTRALLCALVRLPVKEALVEADQALAAWAAKRPIPDRCQGRWLGNILKGWPTPEDMKRSVRPDGSDFTL
jgi:hypothetical protein